MSRLLLLLLLLPPCPHGIRLARPQAV